MTQYERENKKEIITDIRVYTQTTERSVTEMNACGSYSFLYHIFTMRLLKNCFKERKSFPEKRFLVSYDTYKPVELKMRFEMPKTQIYYKI